MPTTIITAALLSWGCARKVEIESSRPGTTPLAGEELDVEAEPRSQLDDNAITEGVERALARATVRAGNVEVSTVAGVVDLTGTFPSIWAKERAVRIIEGVKGVRAVVDRTNIVTIERTDAVLVRDVEHALREDPAVDANAIRVSADDQTVQLRGKVSSRQRKLVAGATAARVEGVRAVDNELAIAYPEPRADLQIERDVRQRLRWDALVDHGLITVEVRDGRVRLGGVVGSAAERRRAAEDAWVAGVTGVDTSALQVQWWASPDELRRGKYAGLSDTEIERAIELALAVDPRVSSFRVEPEVVNGVATLKGEVTTAAARKAAEHDARNTAGVTSVENQLEVRGGAAVKDEELRERIQAALLRDSLVDEEHIEVQVADGRVILTGVVPSGFDKSQAEAIIEGMVGVRSVLNQLAVGDSAREVFDYDPYSYPYTPYARPHPISLRGDSDRPTDEEIERDIRIELYWSPFVDVDQVQVQVIDGRAILTGTVNTQRERQTAVRNAYQGGALIVEDRLVVVPAP